MDRRFGILALGTLLATYACDPVPVQYPPGSAQYPYPTAHGPTTPQPSQITGSQRWQHAWGKALEGVAMGGSIGGPYGAGGGLVIGLITGLFTADSHYGEINRQIYSEQQKDQRLEAAIEQELARQRDLENQIAGVSTASSIAGQPEVRSAVNAKPIEKSWSGGAAQQAKPPENLTLSSISNPPSQQPSPRPFKNVEVKDINRDGIPDLWIYYNPQKPGEILRQEESTKGDGRVDTWSYFKDGQLIRRDVDTKGVGRPDIVYYYDKDALVREERDETGQGSMTYRAHYQDGRLAKVEKDTSSRGRPDLWVYYDSTRDGEIVMKEERDLNGDGVADLWSYYNDGRLTRRDVSAVGLEILSQQEQLPAPSAEIVKVINPDS